MWSGALNAEVVTSCFLQWNLSWRASVLDVEKGREEVEMEVKTWQERCWLPGKADTWDMGDQRVCGCW